MPDLIMKARYFKIGQSAPRNSCFKGTVTPSSIFGGSLAKDKNQIMQIYEEGYEKGRMISDFIYFSNPSGSLER